jgi:hypothetical protein
LIDEHPSKRPVRNIETGEVFPTLTAAGRKYGVSPDYISWAAQGKRDSYAGFHWEFVTESRKKDGTKTYKNKQ